MKKYFPTLLALIIALSVNIFAQEASAPTPEELNDRINGIDERLTEATNDLSGLKKIKISGYFQTQYEHTFAPSGFGISPYDSLDYITDRFRMRRSRLKFAYDAGITSMVIQGDFSNAGFELKDAYLNLGFDKSKEFSLTFGIFNRPNYEVEYSSSQRESLERSRVVLALYPKERDFGVMFTYDNPEYFKLQLAGFNNTIAGIYAQTQPVFGERPLYYMARITKSVQLGEGIDLDFGAHARIGSVSANTTNVIESDKGTKSTTYKTVAVGDGISKSWFGVEAQLYWDFFGGMKILGEYIMGSDVNTPAANTVALGSRTLRERDFAGFYAMLVKNIGTEWQVALKYDSYNPNTAIDEATIDNKAELAVNTASFTLHNYTFSNIRISAQYDMVKTTTNDRILKEDPKDDLFTLRFQYKF